MRSRDLKMRAAVLVREQERQMRPELQTKSDERGHWGGQRLVDVLGLRRFGQPLLACVRGDEIEPRGAAIGAGGTGGGDVLFGVWRPDRDRPVGPGKMRSGIAQDQNDCVVVQIGRARPQVANRMLCPQALRIDIVIGLGLHH